MNTQKEINKYVKEKEESNALLILNSIIDNIKSIDNYSLIIQTIVKNIKNDNNSLLFSNLILKHSDKVKVKDIEEEALIKLYTMSLKSQLASVRIVAIDNLQNDLNNFSLLENQLQELKKTEKNEKVLQLLSHLKF